MRNIKPTTFRTLITVLFSSLIFMAGCKRLDVFEKNTTIPGYQWKSDFAVTGSFTIADTLTSYNIYMVLRHTDAYAYNNIWLNIGLQAPADSMNFQKIYLLLGSDISVWEGAGMNDIWEVRKLLNARPLPFKKPGEYQFRINQIMRDNPLPQIMSAGLRVEKVKAD